MSVTYTCTCWPTYICRARRQSILYYMIRNTGVKHFFKKEVYTNIFIKIKNIFQNFVRYYEYCFLSCLECIHLSIGILVMWIIFVWWTSNLCYEYFSDYGVKYKFREWGQIPNPSIKSLIPCHSQPLAWMHL